MGRQKTKTEKIIQRLLLDKDYWKWETRLKNAHDPLRQKISTPEDFLKFIEWKNIRSQKIFSADEINFLDQVQLFGHFCHKKLKADSPFLVRGLVQQILFGRVPKTFEPGQIRNHFGESGETIVLIEIRKGATGPKIRTHIERSLPLIKKYFRNSGSTSLFDKNYKILECFSRDRIILELGQKTREELGAKKGEYKEMAISRILKDEYGFLASAETVKKVLHTNFLGK